MQLGPGGSGLLGLGLTREVPRDHNDPNDRCRCPRTAVLRSRTVRARRVPGRHRGLTRDACALDLRQFIAWCEEHSLRLFAVRRADIECYARDLEERGRARATVAGGCARSPASTATPSRRGSSSARLRCTSASRGSTTSRTPPGLDRNEVGALLVAAGLASASEHALVSLLGINGLRVSEALGANIEALGLERGHRTLTVLRKAGKVVTIPLAPRTARAIDLAIGERVEGPIFLGGNGERLDRHAAWRIVRRLARRAGINKPVGPHTLRHAFITAALDAGVPLRDVQEAASHADPRTTMRYDKPRKLHPTRARAQVSWS
jgi:integrase/recombinase XerD